MTTTDKPLSVLACGSPWGIGTYMWLDEHGSMDASYGFPDPSMNPHDFSPDRECCTEAEVAAWEAAKVAWDAAHGTPTRALGFSELQETPDEAHTPTCPANWYDPCLCTPEPHSEPKQDDDEGEDHLSWNK
jgi:hypothetical protein